MPAAKPPPPAAGPARDAPRVPCPTCGSPTRYHAGNRWRPFCSERCRSVDLGAWASERFRVPVEAPPEHGPDEDPQARH